MMNGKRCARSTQKSLSNVKRIRNKVFNTTYNDNIIDDEIYIDVEGYFRRGTQFNILAELLKTTGLNSIDFCNIYNCSCIDLESCLNGSMQRIPPRLVQAILRAWADFRFINNEYVKWVTNTYSQNCS